MPNKSELQPTAGWREGLEEAAKIVRCDAFREVEAFIAANGRNADIQSWVEKKICELDSALAAIRARLDEEKEKQENSRNVQGN